MATGDGSISSFTPPDGTQTFEDGTPIPAWLGPLPVAGPSGPTLTPTNPIPWWEQAGATIPSDPIQQSIQDLLGEADQQWATFGQFIPGHIDTLIPPTITTTPGTPAPTPTTPAPSAPNVPPTITVPNPAYTGVAPTQGTGFYHQPFPPYQAFQIPIDKTKQTIPNPGGTGYVPNPFYDPSYNPPAPTLTIPNPAYHPPVTTPAPPVSTGVNVTVNNTIGGDLSAELRAIADAVLANGSEISQTLHGDNATIAQIAAGSAQAIVNSLSALQAGLGTSLSSALSRITDGISAMLKAIEDAAAMLFKLLWDELLDVLKSMGKYFFDEFEGRFMETVTI